MAKWAWLSGRGRPHREAQVAGPWRMGLPESWREGVLLPPAATLRGPWDHCIALCPDRQPRSIDSSFLLKDLHGRGRAALHHPSGDLATTDSIPSASARLQPAHPGLLSHQGRTPLAYFQMFSLCPYLPPDPAPKSMRLLGNRNDPEGRRSFPAPTPKPGPTWSGGATWLGNPTADRAGDTHPRDSRGEGPGPLSTASAQGEFNAGTPSSEAVAVWAVSRVLRRRDAGRLGAGGPGPPCGGAPETRVEHPATCSHSSHEGATTSLALFTWGCTPCKEVSGDSLPCSHHLHHLSCKAPHACVWGAELPGQRTRENQRRYGARRV